MTTQGLGPDFFGEVIIQHNTVGAFLWVESRDHQASDNSLNDEFPEGKEQGSVRPDLACVFRKAVLVWIPAEADFATRICVKTVYLGGDPREHW